MKSVGFRIYKILDSIACQKSRSKIRNKTRIRRGRESRRAEGVRLVHCIFTSHFFASGIYSPVLEILERVGLVICQAKAMPLLFVLLSSFLLSYFSPDGRKFRSKPQIAQYLGDEFDSDKFDFRTGRLNDSRAKSRRNRPDVSYTKDFNNASTVAPKRQTKRGVEKTSVTVIKEPGGKKQMKDAKPEFKRVIKEGMRLTRAQERAEAEIESKRKRIQEASVGKDHEKPKQLFWARRLQGLKAVNASTNETVKPVTLPGEIRNLAPGGDPETLLTSIVSYLHLNNNKVLGQNMSLNAMKKNPGVWCNPEQPFCAPFEITQEMVRDQEKKVENARRNLAEALEILRLLEEEENGDDFIDYDSEKTVETEDEENQNSEKGD